MKSHVSAHKTEVAMKLSTSQSDSSSSKLSDIDRQCPIHKKPHPLKKCRGFRSKPLDERKAFLKENSICFRCCSSTAHLAKSCEVVLKCKECESDGHVTALHPGPAPWNIKDPSSDRGGEGEVETPQSAVTSRCTEVCDQGTQPRSCSKICLVRIFPKEHPDNP